MLSRDAVMLGLTYLATAQRRKVDPRAVDIYHRECGRTMNDAQFGAAISMVLEEEESRWPSIGHLKALARGGGRREVGVPYIRECGPLSECLSDIDSGRSYGGADQYRGRPHTKPHVERLVYEDAAVTVPVTPGEAITNRLRRIAQRAEAELERMESATASSPQPSASQGELPGA